MRGSGLEAKNVVYPYTVVLGHIQFTAYFFLIVMAFVVGYVVLCFVTRILKIERSIGPSLPVGIFMSAMFFSHLYWQIEYGPTFRLSNLWRFLFQGHVFYGGVVGGSFLSGLMPKCVAWILFDF